MVPKCSAFSMSSIRDFSKASVTPEMLATIGVVAPAGLADRKRGQRKGATSENVKNRQKSSKIFSTLFDIFPQSKKSQKSSKSIKILLTLFGSSRAAPVFWPLMGGRPGAGVVDVVVAIVD